MLFHYVGEKEFNMLLYLLAAVPDHHEGEADEEPQGASQLGHHGPPWVVILFHLCVCV